MENVRAHEAASQTCHSVCTCRVHDHFGCQAEPPPYHHIGQPSPLLQSGPLQWHLLLPLPCCLLCCTDLVLSSLTAALRRQACTAACACTAAGPPQAQEAPSEAHGHFPGCRGTSGSGLGLLPGAAHGLLPAALATRVEFCESVLGPAPDINSQHNKGVCKAPRVSGPGWAGVGVQGYAALQECMPGPLATLPTGSGEDRLCTPLPRVVRSCRTVSCKR